MVFIDNLKYLREEHNLTQKELAKLCKLSPQCISALETGRNLPTSHTLTVLANFFKCSIEELLGVDSITPTERAAGASATVKVSITPLEDDMLYAFRQVGKKLGEKGQLALIDVAQSMAGIK